MAMSDWFMLIHPTMAIAIGFPLLGIVPLLFGHNGCKVDDLFIRRSCRIFTAIAPIVGGRFILF